MKFIIAFLLRRIPRKYLQFFSPVALRTVTIFYRGNKVECPICESQFFKFLPFGRIPRSNALCPTCLALERHRLIWLYLKRKTDFFTKKIKMLHIAPELCFINHFKTLKNLEYLTGDIESPLADIKMDIHKIPLEDNSIDVIFCNHVLEHVEDDMKALSEIRRVLKPNGWAILQVPFYNPLPKITYEDKSITEPKAREKAFGQSDHVRMYGEDYSERLASSGFRVIEEKLAIEITLEERSKYAVQEEEIIYKVIK